MSLTVELNAIQLISGGWCFGIDGAVRTELEPSEIFPLRMQRI